MNSHLETPFALRNRLRASPKPLTRWKGSPFRLLAFSAVARGKMV